MTNTQFKPVVRFETRADLESAWTAKQVSSEQLFQVVEDDTFYRCHEGNGLVEITDPNSPTNDNVYIWWQDKIHVRWNNLLRDKAGHDLPDQPVLPGNLAMSLDMINESTLFDGHFIVPLTLRAHFDPDILLDVLDSQALKDILQNQFIGIPFEACHYTKVRAYSGIITTQDLRKPNLEALRETLSVGNQA